MLVDTHCHLNFEAFDEDRSAVLERARQVGVIRVLNPGVDVTTSQTSLALARAVPEVYAAVGLHPTEASIWSASQQECLRDLACQPKVVAIGEIGLDYYWERAPHALQQQVFQHQLDLAAELNLPVVVHVRERDPSVLQAWEDALEILGRWQSGLRAAGAALAERPGVLHSFSGDMETAQRAVALGFWIGITGPVTFRKAPVLQQVAMNVPLERLLVETDAPFLTPHPYRGRRNEPAYVAYVVEKIAGLRGLSPVETAQMIAVNAERLFLW